MLKIATIKDGLAKAFSGAFARLAFVAIALFICVNTAFAVKTYDTYYSPKNKERAVRKSTLYIILHTTEGASRGAGEKLKKNGEAHYMVDTTGKIYRIIDRTRVAFHCGRSMWNGRTSIDNYSIGIEVVGYHNKDLRKAQYKPLRDLVAELQRIYNIPDDRVLTHSMVAYGAPNQWHKRSHRGRKRCGMRMALSSVRINLGLYSKPAYDPDVKANRLVVADKELHQLLYSVDKRAATKSAPAAKSVTQSKQPVIRKPAVQPENVIGRRRSAWDIAGGAYDSETTLYIFPDGTRKCGDEITDWKAMKAGTQVIIGYKEEPPKKPEISAPAVQPDAVDEAQALAQYEAKEGDDSNIIGPRRSAWDIARDLYNAETTIYIFPDGTQKKGSEIKKWKSMKAGTKVIVQDGDDANEPETLVSLESASVSIDDLKKMADVALSSIAGAEWNSEKTIYILPGGKYFHGGEIDAERIASLTTDTVVLSGYRIGGPITAKKPAFDICGPMWQDSGTHYLFPNGKLVKGDEIDHKKIPAGTMVLYKD